MSQPHHIHTLINDRINRKIWEQGCRQNQGEASKPELCFQNCGEESFSWQSLVGLGLGEQGRRPSRGGSEALVQAWLGWRHTYNCFFFFLLLIKNLITVGGVSLQVFPTLQH